jgi:ribose 5-phosphate isomerase B
MEIVRVWMTTDWLGSSDQKYARRVGKVVDIDAKHVS